MKHFFLRTADGFPIGCIVTEKQSTPEGGGKLLYGLSVCNPLDFVGRKFKTARCLATATERLKFYMEGRYADHQPPADKSKPDFDGAKVGTVEFAPGESPKLKLLEYVKRNGDLPSRMRKAAKHEITLLKQRIEERLKATAEAAAPPPEAAA